MLVDWPKPMGGRHCITAAALAVLTIVACSEPFTAPRPLPLTVSGTLVNRSGAPIPTGVRALVVWSTGDERAYVFGAGTVDLATNTFSVTFDRNVPEAARYDGSLGIGLVVLTTDGALGEGLVPRSYDFASNFVGVTGQYAVIYLDSSPSQYGSDWAASFRRGYNVGRGIDLPGLFDGFEPVGLGSMELIVDELGNIELVNWT